MKQKYKKVVEWNFDGHQDFQGNPFLWAIAIYLLLWITSFFWFPFYAISDFKSKRKVHWEKIK